MHTHFGRVTCAVRARMSAVRTDVTSRPLICAGKHFLDGHKFKLNIIIFIGEFLSFTSLPVLIQLYFFSRDSAKWIVGHWNFGASCSLFSQLAFDEKIKIKIEMNRNPFSSGNIHLSEIIIHLLVSAHHAIKWRRTSQQQQCVNQ